MRSVSLVLSAASKGSMDGREASSVCARNGLRANTSRPRPVGMFFDSRVPLLQHYCESVKGELIRWRSANCGSLAPLGMTIQVLVRTAGKVSHYWVARRFACARSTRYTARYEYSEPTECEVRADRRLPRGLFQQRADSGECLGFLPGIRDHAAKLGDTGGIAKLS